MKSLPQRQGWLLAGLVCLLFLCSAHQPGPGTLLPQAKAEAPALPDAFLDRSAKKHSDRIRPVRSNIPEEEFQTRLVAEALKSLGYDVAEPLVLPYGTAHMLIARGGADFMANHWNPSHAGFFRYAGGKEKLFRGPPLVRDSLQGYLIDEKTAAAHNITSLADFRRPGIAALFDQDQDGRADLTGCDPGWSCADVIDFQLARFGLNFHITHIRGGYASRIEDSLDAVKNGKPAFFYGWTPSRTLALVTTGKDVRWLNVPASAMPGPNRDLDTSLPDGSNPGFPVNSQHIIANRALVEKHPDIRKLFDVMSLSANEIAEQNLKLRSGNQNLSTGTQDVQVWIRNHPDRFQGWISHARGDDLTENAPSLEGVQ